jgi:hypothetical protein
MIAVSNTTPLRYLIAIEQENLFSGVFEKIFVPSAVHEELTKMGTPERASTLYAHFLPGTKYAKCRVHPQFHFPRHCIVVNDKLFCSPRI